MFPISINLLLSSASFHCSNIETWFVLLAIDNYEFMVEYNCAKAKVVREWRTMHCNIDTYLHAYN